MKKKQQIKWMLLAMFCLFTVGCGRDKALRIANGMLNEYTKITPLEYFDYHGNFYQNLSSKTSKYFNETHEYKEMTLKYYPEEQKAYGTYQITKYYPNDENWSNRIESIYTIPVMLDQDGYHIKNIEKNKKYEEEIIHFKFMREQLNLTKENRKDLKVVEASYITKGGSPLSVRYEFKRENSDVESFILEKGLKDYGLGNAISIGESHVTLRVGQKEEASISEQGNLISEEDSVDYRRIYFDTIDIPLLPKNGNEKKIFEENGKYGLQNTNGEVVLVPSMAKLLFIKEWGYYVFKYQETDKFYGVMDENGSIVQEPFFAKLRIIQDKNLILYSEDVINEGFISWDAHTKTEAVYSFYWDAFENYHVARVKLNGDKVGIMNDQLEWVREPFAYEIQLFNGVGQAKYQNSYSEYNKYLYDGMIDLDGKLIPVEKSK